MLAVTNSSLVHGSAMADPNIVRETVVLNYLIWGILGLILFFPVRAMAQDSAMLIDDAVVQVELVSSQTHESERIFQGEGPGEYTLSDGTGISPYADKLQVAPSGEARTGFPEPSVMLLLLAGLIALTFSRRRSSR